MNAVEDLSKLTSISPNYIQLIFDKLSACICYNVHEQIKNKLDYIEVDIGIGTLLLYIKEDNVLYKFIPSEKLENDIIYTINNNQDILISKLENSLQDKIIAAYKEFF